MTADQVTPRNTNSNKCKDVNYDTRGNVIADDTSQAKWDVGRLMLSGEMPIRVSKWSPLGGVPRDHRAGCFLLWL